MSIAVCLLLYSAVVAVVGPPVLSRLRCCEHAPHLAITAWLAAIASVLATWLAATALMGIDVARHWNSPALVVAACVARLQAMAVGAFGVAAQVVLVAAVTVTGAAAAVLTVRVARTLVGLRHSAHEHARAVRIVGRATGADDVLVVDAAAPGAYCVAGRPAAIVLTTGALGALDDRQLAAVLAHERAHLAGYHLQLVCVLRALAAVLPRVRLITAGAAEVARLLEMCADDACVRQHGRAALLSGLMELAATAPAGALGAANLAVLRRAERLITPPGSAARTGAATLWATAAVFVAVGPAFIEALFLAGLLCGP